MRRTTITLATLLALAALTHSAWSANEGAPSGCAPGDRVDRSTAADARKKIEAAGYRNVGNLKKGCDNAWHGVAVKDGESVHVVLNPEGKVLPEGD